MHSPVNDAQQAWLTGTSQKLTSHRYIPAASWAHFVFLCAHSSQCVVLSLARVHLHVHNGKQSTQTLLGIAILSGAAERMPDQLWASACNMPLRNQPITPLLNSCWGLIYNFYEKSSGHSIYFVITTEGFLEQPNLEWSKGYRCNHAAQSANEISPTTGHPCLLLEAMSH